MTIENQLKHGADKLIAASAKSSNHNAHLAIGQLLMAASCLAKTIGMSRDDFLTGCQIGADEAFAGLSRADLH